MLATEKSERWNTIIADWRQSGQTQKQYCSEHGLSYSTFCYWRRACGEDRSLPSADKIQAIEIARIPAGQLQDVWSSDLAMELEAEGIVLTVAGSEATVRISGRMRLGDLRRIMAACEGTIAHAPA